MSELTIEVTKVDVGLEVTQIQVNANLEITPVTVTSDLEIAQTQVDTLLEVTPVLVSTNQEVTQTIVAADLKIEVGKEGPPGPPGGAGEPGADGLAATIEVGDVDTGAPGTNALITNSGTLQAAMFNFIIPRGDKGDPGEDAFVMSVTFRPNAQLSGVQDGVNRIFALATGSIVASSTMLFLNGQRQSIGLGNDYVEISATQVELSSAPYPDDTIIMDCLVT